jgi:hypothetical protein
MPIATGTRRKRRRNKALPGTRLKDPPRTR